MSEDPCLKPIRRKTGKERKVRWNLLCKIQEKMSSSFARPASRTHTNSSTQFKEKRKRSKASDKPQCSKPKEHPPHRHSSQASGSASKSLSTTSSKPCINARQNVTLSMQHTQSSLTVRQVEQSTTKRKGNSGPHHAATRCKASEQWKSKQRRHHFPDQTTCTYWIQ